MEIYMKKKRRLKILNAIRKGKKKSQGDDIFIKCLECANSLIKRRLIENKYVCDQCNYHFRISAHRRLGMVMDEGKYREFNKNLLGRNPIDFPGYGEKIKEIQKKTGIKEAVVTVTGKIAKINTVVCVLDSRFMMGSMGTAVGEKITAAIEYATKNKMPLIIFSASGGARMQEGIFSLMQMAKTSAAIERHSVRGLLYISIMTHPTTGGVTASFASLGDIILAEPKALIGFAGPRVIKQTIRQTLPKGFQSAEYLMTHGFLDAIVERKDMRETIIKLLKFHS